MSTKSWRAKSVKKTKITVDKLIQEICEILEQWGGADIVDLYNEKIGTKRAKYLGDSLVEIEE